MVWCSMVQFGSVWCDAMRRVASGTNGAARPGLGEVKSPTVGTSPR